MHILYVYANFTTATGSCSTRAYDFAQRWIEKGHDVTIITGVYDRSDLRPGRLLWSGTVNGITVRALNLRFSNQDRFLWRVTISLLLGAFAAWHATIRSYDLALISCGSITLGCAGLAARWIRRRPVVFEVRDLFSEGLEQLGIVTNRAALKALRRFEDLCYREADGVVVLSETMAEWIRQRHDPRHIAVIPNTANVELFGRATPRPAEMAADGANFLYAGTLGRANACGQILRAGRYLKQWGRDDIHLYLIGEGAERQKLEEEAVLGGLDQVHFLPPMPNETLAGWLAAATGLVLVLQPIPVFDTVSPKKFFDALAAGIPVIQTTQGWIREVLAEHDCGLTVDPKWPPALAQAIAGLSDDLPGRDRMGRNAHRVACERFETGLLADRMLDALILADGPRGTIFSF